MNFNKSPQRFAVDTFGGVLIGIVLTYCAFHAREFLAGNFFLDLDLIRSLCIIGLLVVGYSWYENRALFK